MTTKEINAEIAKLLGFTTYIHKTTYTDTGKTEEHTCWSCPAEFSALHVADPMWEPPDFVMRIKRDMKVRELYKFV